MSTTGFTLAQPIALPSDQQALVNLLNVRERLRQCRAYKGHTVMGDLCKLISEIPERVDGPGRLVTAKLFYDPIKVSVSPQSAASP
jgi:hypothetical protein